MFRPSFHVEILKPDRVFLLDDINSHRLLEGKLCALVASLISKGRYSSEEIINRLEGKAPLEEIYYILYSLEAAGLIEERASLPNAASALCGWLGISLEEGKRRLEQTAVSMLSIGKASSKTLEKELGKLAIRTESSSQALTVVVTDHYRREELLEMNKKFLKEKKSYLLIKPLGAIPWIGPLIVPGKTACLECLWTTLLEKHFEEICIETAKHLRSPLQLKTKPPRSVETLCHAIAATEIFKWVVKGKNDTLEGKILSYHFLHTKTEVHHVLKRTHCTTCGVAPEQPRPLVLDSQKKQFTDDGGHRIVSPEETFKKYAHLISPITGVVDFLDPATEEMSPLLHIYRSGHFSGKLERSHRPSLDHVRAGSAGKGKTAFQAKASCLCEALERYSCILQGHESRKQARYVDIKGEAIHPASFLLFSEKQYLSREAHNPGAHRFHLIPAPFPEEKTVDWTPIWSLTEKRFKWMPLAAAYFAPALQDPKDYFCGSDSNGCASGNTKEEAILQGFFELVERDAVALWWYPRTQRAEVDLQSFKDSYIDQLVSLYASRNRSLFAIDLTTDLQIPAIAAISIQQGGQILLGFGAHFDPKIALLRALTEVNQILPLCDCLEIKSKEYSLTTPKKEPLHRWMETAFVKDHPYLLPHPKLKMKTATDYLRFDTEDVKEDVLQCQRIVEEKGMEMLILDMTRPDIALPVVRVLVPGLRHFWNRFAPGRLYEIPKKLGLVETELLEEALNPIPMFL